MSNQTNTTPLYAPWDKWDPVKYLNTYFQELRKDEDETLKFLVRSIQSLKNGKHLKVLEFGAGPTVVHAIAATPVASEIHIADYLRENLAETRRWINEDKNAFNWDLFTKRILQLEGVNPTEKEISERNNELRKKVKNLLRCDASLEFPLSEKKQTYDLLIMTYCIDSATSSKDVWRAYMKNVLKLLAPQGTMLMAALHNCQFYTVGNYCFPSANLNEEDLKHSLLNNGFNPENISIEVQEVPECKQEGYSSLLFAKASKK